MEEKELSKGTKIKIAIITVLVILTTIAGITYAFFSIGVTGNEEASSVTVTAALLRLSYSDNLVISGNGIYPGWSQSKTVTVQNTGTDTVYYKIIWRELLNEITNDELTISATCVASSGTCPTISETPISTYLSQTSNVDIKDKIGIAPNVTHTYTVTVTFKEMSSAQNYNQGKSFYGTLNIAEGKKPPIRTGNTYEGMDIVKIKDEEFYDITNVVNYSSLISQTGNIYNFASDKTVLLARYNLYVGRIFRSGIGVTEIEPSANGYGLQSIDAKGFIGDWSKPVIAVVPFSGSVDSNGYWYDSTNSRIKSKYGIYSSHGNNIYDKDYTTAPNWSAEFLNDTENANYSVAYYVENYVSRLGVNATGRLLTYPEANAMTQPQRTNGATYWLGSAYYQDAIDYVNYDGGVGAFSYHCYYELGVRPVLVISTSDIQ